MEDVLRRFRALSSRLGRGGRGRRYPAEVRELAVEYFVGASEQGRSRQAIARALGISEATLARWVEGSGRQRPRLLEVVMAEPRAAAGLTLSTPSGYRVEGLSLSEVTALLTSLP